MPSFFIPGAQSESERDSIYANIRQHVGDKDSTWEGKLFSLEWWHEGKKYAAKVGETTEFNKGLVIAILFDRNRNLYHVCTPYRGVLSGGSILVGVGNAIRAEYFDA